MHLTKPGFYNQWSYLFSDECNWRDFTFIRFETERDYITGSFTVYLSLLGLNFHWTLIYDEQKHAEMLADIDRMMAGFEVLGEPGRVYEVTQKELDQLKESKTNGL